MTREEAAQLVSVLFSTYPNTNVERRHVDAYISGLLDLPAAEAGRAVDRLRRTSKFLPSVSELREGVVDLSVGHRRTGIEAWTTLQEACRRWGWQQPPKITDPHMERAITALGGWVAVCSITTDAEMSARARFIEAYDVFARRERLDLESGIPLPKGASVLQMLAGKKVKP
jgi:hypothetical protein